LECAFGVVGKIFNGIYLVTFWIQNVRAIDFSVISATENSNKLQKTRFWKEKSVEDMVTLGPTAQATLVTITKEVCDSVW
jgi:hypothetical protein